MGSKKEKRESEMVAQEKALTPQKQTRLTSFKNLIDKVADSIENWLENRLVRKEETAWSFEKYKIAKEIRRFEQRQTGSSFRVTEQERLKWSQQRWLKKLAREILSHSPNYVDSELAAGDVAHLYFEEERAIAEVFAKNYASLKKVFSTEQIVQLEAEFLEWAQVRFNQKATGKVISWGKGTGIHQERPQALQDIVTKALRGVEDKARQEDQQRSEESRGLS